MENIKNILFQYLTPRQKSQLLGTLKAYHKKFSNLSNAEIKDKFLEDEKYYLDIENPHFEFLRDYFDDENFLKDLKRYLDFLSYQDEQLKKAEPYLQKQKELAKIARKKAQDYKMSKLKPTKKQLWYYEKVAKAHNVPQKPLEGATRLDLRNWIMEIIEPKTQGEEDFDE